jgi:rhodanese-related sulfurtransferase
MHTLKKKVKLILVNLGLATFLFLGLNTAYSCPPISPVKLKELLTKDKCIFIIDVRHPIEFSQGHIERANLIPLDVFDYIYLAGLKDKMVVVYSERGRRGQIACRKLQYMGIIEVYNLDGGLRAWQMEGLPVVHGYK